MDPRDYEKKNLCRWGRICRGKVGMFSFHRSCQKFFRMVVPLYAHIRRCMRNPVTHILSWCQSFLILAILVGERCYFIVVLFYIFLMTNDFEPLFIQLLAIWISFCVTCLFKSFAHLKNDDYLLWIWGSSLFFKTFVYLKTFSPSCRWHSVLH